MLPLIWAIDVQYIIPAVFLVIWVINQVFNREDKAQPAPARPGGPAANPPRAPQRGAMPPGAPPRRSPTMSWDEMIGPDSNRRQLTQSPSQEMVFFEPDPKAAPPLPPRQPRPERSRRASRSRTQDSHARPDAASRPTVFDHTPPAGKSSLVDLAPSTSRQQLQPVTMDRLRQSLLDPLRIREALLLNEILGPPVAIRRGRSAARAGGPPPGSAPDPNSQPNS